MRTFTNIFVWNIENKAIEIISPYQMNYQVVSRRETDWKEIPMLIGLFGDKIVLLRKLKPISPQFLTGTVISQNKILTQTLILLSILGWNFWLIVPRTASTETAEALLLPIFYFRFNGLLLAATYFMFLMLTFWHQNCCTKGNSKLPSLVNITVTVLLHKLEIL